ncbi:MULTISPECIES: hypothetical protein [Bacillus subtilis group]|uniref:hypothetical protein n=1 Tax=Bacillus subtilis group TaxID=653685 RepID=UPI0009B7E767|nr:MULTISPECIES: hypothetical protein [Bacillus subtilis group]ARC72541.1 hypothetical protein B37_00488 [Bacillus licheniformis]ARW41675.1 hypothetical protein S100141_00352 [Bacillus licheniformis]ARW56526.1 hypothetical protein S100027_04562 [Bacillus licheniformis]AXF87795.1 hypothetical protein BLDA23_05715 [Bacillus licheniformis]MCA1182439.1 hypothetical protein [Bacillus licheniformis]
MRKPMVLSEEEVLNSVGTMMIMTGATRLVEHEGMTPHEALQQMERVKNSVFHVLSEIHREVNQAEKEVEE